MAVVSKEFLVTDTVKHGPWNGCNRSCIPESQPVNPTHLTDVNNLQVQEPYLKSRTLFALTFWKALYQREDLRCVIQVVCWTGLSFVVQNASHSLPAVLTACMQLAMLSPDSVIHMQSCHYCDHTDRLVPIAYLPQLMAHLTSLVPSFLMAATSLASRSVWCIKSGDQYCCQLVLNDLQSDRKLHLCHALVRHWQPWFIIAIHMQCKVQPSYAVLRSTCPDILLTNASRTWIRCATEQPAVTNLLVGLRS